MELVRCRGGLGLRREIRLLDGEARYSVRSDRAVLPPFGVRGGGPAASVRVSIRRDAEETELATPGKVTGHAISAGDTVIMGAAAAMGTRSRASPSGCGKTCWRATSRPP